MQSKPLYALLHGTPMEAFEVFAGGVLVLKIARVGEIPVISLSLFAVLKYVLQDLCAGSLTKFLRIFVSVLGRVQVGGVNSLGKSCVAIILARLSLF